ncbi:MAG: hypothetical protein ABMA15_15525 [Vicinamibacterales bacterium]
MLNEAIWTCKIGELDRTRLGPGADATMRLAVREAYTALTGRAPDFIFSGWAGELTSLERATVLDTPALATYRVG